MERHWIVMENRPASMPPLDTLDLSLRGRRGISIVIGDASCVIGAEMLSAELLVALTAECEPS
jgi:hypothetical protein